MNRPARWRRVCDASALLDGGDGVVVALPDRPGAGGSSVRVTAFVIRHQGRARGFVNRCAHVPIELDWLPGRFFDEDGARLLCSVHGAEYDPSSGACLGGPCAGRGGLRRLTVDERDGGVWLLEDGDHE